MKKLLIATLSTFVLTTAAVAENPRDDFGIEHNEQVIYALQNLDTVPAPEDANHVVAGLLCQYLSVMEGGCVWPPFPGFPFPWPDPTGPWLLDDLDLYASASSLGLSADLEYYVHETLHLSEAGLSLPDFDQALTTLENEAAATLSSDDLWTYYGFSSVARHSSRLWLSEEEGGMGAIHQLNPATGVDTVEVAARIKWWKVALADAIGALQTGTVIGAAGASVISVLKQL